MVKLPVSGTGVHNEHRLTALRHLGILDSPPEAAFERLTQLVTRLLQVPVALVSLVDEHRQFFKSAVGLQEPWASSRETPLSHSFCQHVVETDQPLIVDNASSHPLVWDNPGIRDLNIYAYLGIPLTTSDGMVLGALCAIDTGPRKWSTEDFELLTDLAASVVTELELRQDTMARRQAEKALYESNARFAGAFKLASIGMVLADLEGRCLQVNQAFCRLMGYSEEELRNRTLHQLTYSSDQDKDADLIQQLLQATISTYHIEKRYIHRYGHMLWVEINASLVRNIEGIPQYFVYQIQDITQRHQYEYERQCLIEQLTEALDRHEALLRQSSEDLQRTEVLYNVAATLNHTQAMPAILHTVVESAAKVLPAHRTMLITLDMERGQVQQHLEGGPGARHGPPLSFVDVWNGLSGIALRKGQPVFSSRDVSDALERGASQPHRLHEESGSILIVPIQSQGKILGTLSAINAVDGRDFSSADMDLLITLANHAAVAIERSILLEELQHNATIDGLTQLLNRRSWFEQSQRIVTLAEQYGHSLSVVILDIDHFKHINDSYGHAVGDTVLQEISQLIYQKIRKRDILGRYGGEEFVILLPETDAVTAQHIAERIRQAVACHRFIIDQHHLETTISLGVATMQGVPLDIRSLLMQADQALYQAKEAGRNRTQLVRNA